MEELKHSCLIVAGDVVGGKIFLSVADTPIGRFGLLFTDMDEFKKSFPDFGVEAHEGPFLRYKMMMSESDDLNGFIINLDGEFFILSREMIDAISFLPKETYNIDNSYTSAELKMLKDTMDNSRLEEFINDPNNIGKYEELFERISSSTLLTLMLSREDLLGIAKDGVISLEDEPLGFLYVDEVGGNFATVYTSEENISNIRTPFNKYSQIVNFSRMANFILNDDMDGIIINPNFENVLLTRDVLLEYSNLLEKTCDDERLNTAIFNMFLMEA